MLKAPQKFGTRGLTHSAAHHLLAVDESVEKSGYARVSDIARQLGITRGSVSVAMQSLKSAGYVEQDDNHFFILTAKGKQAIASIKTRHEVVERFLQEVLCLSPEQSHKESCQMENLIGAQTTLRLSALLTFWDTRQLSEEFKPDNNDHCSDCDIADGDNCPCCGLECIDDACQKH